MSRRLRSSAASARVLTGFTMLAVLALAACGGGDLTPSTPDAVGVHPAVTPRQAVQILANVDAAVVRGMNARDVTQFAGRVVGPERDALAAAIKVQAVLKLSPTAPPAPSKPRLLTTTAGPWPRWFMVAGSNPSEPTPLLRLLYSPDPRSPYGLWSQLDLLPGDTLPDVASPTTGAVRLAADASGLVASPSAVITHYTDLLNRGDASAYRNDFSADQFRTELNNQLKTDRAAAGSIGVGAVMSSHSVAPGPVFALATVNGGALVIGRVDQKYMVTVTRGRGSVQLDQQLAALAGRVAVGVRLERTAAQTLAFYVPRAGSAGKVTLLAASKADIAASGS
jgi:hypothetical protein